jgi:hypothetical protein
MSLDEHLITLGTAQVLIHRGLVSSSEQIEVAFRPASQEYHPGTLSGSRGEARGVAIESDRKDRVSTRIDKQAGR